MSTLSVDTIQGQTAAAKVIFPAGVVIQTHFHTFTTQTSVTSNSYSDVGGSSFSFTPKFASSVLHISYSVHVYSFRSSDDNGGSVDINVDGSNISASGDTRELLFSIGGASSLAFFTRIHKEVSVAATNTSAKTIKLQMQNNQSGNSGGFRINDGGAYTSSIKVQEIAQ